MSDEMVIDEGSLSPADLQMALDLRKELATEKAEAPEPPEQTQPEPDSEPATLDEPEQGHEVEESTSEDQKDDGELAQYKFSVKGQDRDYTHDQLQKMLAREETFQQKWEKHRVSDAYKLGALMAAAKDGDKGAQKQLLSELEGMSDDLDVLRESEEKFDVDSKIKDDELDSAFADVKSDVDYETTLGKIDSDLKGKMPEKVFEEYSSNPQTKRVMYDLIRSGRTDEIFEALNKELGSLSLAERVRYKQDADLYGGLFYEVVQDLNARKAQPEEKAPPKSAIDTVSSGKRSHRQDKPDTGPDFANMSASELAAWEKKNLGKVI